MSAAHTSAMYRAMTYFAVATLHLYRADISAELRANMEIDTRAKVEWFIEWAQPQLIQRVMVEGRNLMSYELSHRQMCAAVFSYFAPAQSIANSKAYELERG